ncbi:SdrD B-like domain-containing protein [Lacisediminihabitans sp. FW035]
MKTFLRSLVITALVALSIVVPVTSGAQAAGSPNVQLSRTVDSSTLYGRNVAITLSATQTTGPQAYNLSFTDILPAGAVITSSAYPVTKLIALPGGTTQVIWSNVADLSTGTVVPLAYSYSYPTATYDVGAVFTGTGGAYVNSDARTVPKFSATTGAPTVGSFTGSDTSTSSTTLVPYLVEKSEPSPESELLRGVHDHKTVYTVKITNNLVKSTTGFTLTDYLPAGLEFLGCTNVDNTTVGDVEYPGSGRISDTALPTMSTCVVPSAVTTVTSDPDGAGPLVSGVYTKVDWTGLGDLAPNGTLILEYAAAIPLRANVAFAGTATANLDNNTGPLTTDEQQLTNLAVATGVSGGTTYPVSDTFTVSAEDVALQKSVNQATITQGGASAWTLNIESSEFALSTGPITVVDTLPDGLDFVSSTPAPSSISAPAANGTITIIWTLAGFTASSSTATITLNTVARATYRSGGGPVSANDSWTNSATLATNATVITAADGSTNVLPIVDASSASQSAVGVQLDKQVAGPGPAIPVDCGAASGLAFHQSQQGPFHPGDRVCYLLTADFPGALNTLNNSFTDFLPAGYSYESYQLGSGNTVTGITFSGGTVAAPNPTWKISNASIGTRFEVLLTTRITDANAIATGDITSNLFKLTYENSAGSVFQLRDLADTLVTKPVLALAKGITALNGTAVPGAPVDTLTVQRDDAVTYAVTVNNTGGQDASNAGVRDNLPPLIHCADVTLISAGGTCDSGTNRIVWSGVAVAAGASTTLTYVVTTPATASPRDTYLNTAGVTTYQGDTNTGTPFTYVPSSNIDPTLETQANSAPAKDTAQATVRQPSITKTAATSVTEGGNADTSPTVDQATIGELVTYTATATIPQGTSLYGPASITDAVDGRFVIVGTPTFTVAGGAPQSATLAGNTITATIPTTYSNLADSGDDVVVLSFSARVKDVAGTVRGNVIPNQATLGWSNSVGTARTVTSAATQTTVVEPNISIPKSSNAVAGSVVAGQIVSFTLGLTNGGGANVSTAHNLVIVDTVPSTLTPVDAAGVAAVDGSVLPAADGTTSPNGGVWNLTARTITFSRTSIAPASLENLTYRAQVNNPLVSGASIVNTVKVTADSLATGGRTGYQATSSLTLTAPEIGVTKSATPGARTIGEVVTYTVDVTVPASVVAYDVTARDTLPANTRFGQLLTATCTQGAGSCVPDIVPTVIGTPTAADTVIGYFLGDLDSPAATARIVHLTYTGIVAPGAASGDSLVNSIAPFYNRTDKITGTPTTVPAGVTFDASATPATASVAVVEPRLTIDKDVVGQVADTDTRRAKPGQTLTYTVAVRNTGTSPAYAVKVTDTPDNRVTGFTSTPPAGVVATDTDPSDGTLSWTIAGPIAVNATVTIAYSVTMPALTAADEIVPGPEIVNTADIPSYAGVDPALQQPGITYLDYNNVTADVVGVELDLASVAKHVWFDANGDGVQNASEPSLPGVGVTVLYAGADGIFGNADDESHSTTTDANGDYLVDQLPGGLYRVTAATPTGMSPSYDLDGGTTTPNGVWQGALAENAKKVDVNFGFTGTGSIGDRVWFDQDGDTTQDAGEPGLPGIPVTVVWGGPDGLLTTTADNVSYPTTTGANGAYLVSKLPPGPYMVTLGTLPNGYTVDADPAGGTTNTSALTLTAGQNNLVQDFGLDGTGSIGDFVWLDRDGDGVQDATEPGIVGATVVLTWLGVDGVAGGGDDATFSTTTNSTGGYLFDRLLPGTYSVRVTGGLPLGATNSFDLDGNNNSIAPVILAAGQSNLGVDFGYHVTSIIGDRVWWDRNRDGVQDAGEPGISGVGISVTYLGADGVAGGGDDLVFTTTTDVTGAWSVTQIPDGKFVVQVTGGVPTGFSPTYDADSGTASPDGKSTVTFSGSNLLQDFGYAGTSGLGDTVWLDLDGDGVQGTGEPGLSGFTATLVWYGPDAVKGGTDDVTFTTTTDAAGHYGFAGLPAGEYDVAVAPSASSTGLVPTYDLDGTATPSTTHVSLAAATVLATADFGYIGSGSIGDTVWLDQNADGVKSAGEPGLADVVVTLRWAGLDDLLGTADDVTSTTTTDSAGAYLFERLPAGVFTVTLSNLPAGITSTVDPDGGADNRSQLTLAGAEANLTQDFGYVGDAGVGDLLWLDVNHDGIRDAGEPGIPTVLITVRTPGADGVFGTTDDIVVKQRTDADGKYLVEGLPAGGVVVSYDPTELPLGRVPSSDLDGTDAVTTSTTLTAGATRLDVDFVVVGSATLNGTIYDDRNGSGQRDAGEPGIPGIGVIVVWHGPAGNAAVHVVTDADGHWQLPTLPAGDYTVTLDPSTVPTGFRATTSGLTTLALPPFGVLSAVDGLTTLPLASTGGAIGVTGLIALLLLSAGLASVLVARRRRAA